MSHFFFVFFCILKLEIEKPLIKYWKRNCLPPRNWTALVKIGFLEVSIDKDYLFLSIFITVECLLMDKKKKKMSKLPISLFTWLVKSKVPSTRLYNILRATLKVFWFFFIGKQWCPLPNFPYLNRVFGC